jgi:ribosome production factor 2
MKSTSSSDLVSEALKDLYALKKPDAILFSRKNEIRPFEDPRALEFFSTKNEAAFIVIASHQKKRPHCLTIARMYDYQLLDMIELSIIDYTMMEAFKVLLLVFSSLVYKSCLRTKTFNYLSRRILCFTYACRT